jgi:hypothetical protein
MFFPGSRYLNAKQYVAVDATGARVPAISIYRSSTPPLLGYYRRKQNQRLDQIADFYLADATASWQLCDANGSIVPDALGASDLVGIPKKG